MKRITLIGLLLSILCTTQAKERIIERPPLLAWSSTCIEIDKMVISDTATIVHIKAFYRPKNWIKIAKGSFLRDNNGQLYPIRSGIGITLDKEFWMPESGEAEFQLVFPSIPETVTSVDFSEGDFDGAYKIWGIQLDKKAFTKQKAPKEAITYKIDKQTELPSPEFRLGKGTLKGQILNYNKDMPNSFTLYVNDPIKGTQDEHSVSIKEDGTFQTTINMITVTPALIRLPFATIPCLIAPGEETILYINSRECTRRQSRLHKDDTPYGLPVYYSGYMARQQQELSGSELKKDISNISLSEVNNKTVEEVKEVVLKHRESILAKIEQAPLSKDTKEILRMESAFSTAGSIANIESLIRHAYIDNHTLTREQTKEYFENTKIDIPKGFYDTLKEFAIINTPQAHYVPTLYYRYSLGRCQDILKDLWGGDQGPFFAAVKASQLAKGIQDFTPLTSEQKAQLNTFPSPAYGEFINQINNELLEKIESNKRKTGFTINEAGQVTNEDLFASIISKFRGHTLLVDFWATWCGPCRMANKEMIPMKEELKDKDIIYLYITGESSPMGTWQNMIPDIHGEHYRVTKEQWSYLTDHLDIQGVPTYFVIDKEGNITFKETGFPGANTMKKKLMEVLSK